MSRIGWPEWPRKRVEPRVKDVGFVVGWKGYEDGASEAAGCLLRVGRGAAA